MVERSFCPSEFSLLACSSLRDAFSASCCALRAVNSSFFLLIKSSNWEAMFSKSGEEEEEEEEDEEEEEEEEEEEGDGEASLSLNEERDSWRLFSFSMSGFSLSWW